MTVSLVSAPLPTAAVADGVYEVAVVCPRTSVEEVIRPQVMRDQSGKPVSVQKWMPKEK